MPRRAWVVAGLAALAAASPGASGAAHEPITRCAVPDPGAFAGGQGTSEDPLQVATARQLARIGMSDAALACAYRQVDDIVLTGTWTPIGPRVADGEALPFSGSYDGGGHAITGLDVERVVGVGDHGFAGLFGMSSGVITRTHVQGRMDLGEALPGIDYLHAGGIVGRGSGRVERSSAAVRITVAICRQDVFASVGGLGGQMLVEPGVADRGIVESRASGSITLRGCLLEGFGAGGLVASAYSVPVIRSASSVDVDVAGYRGFRVESSNIGGLLGLAAWADVEDSYATGSVSAPDRVEGGTMPDIINRAGGLAGTLAADPSSGDGVLTRVYASGRVSDGEPGQVGGLAGVVIDGPPAGATLRPRQADVRRVVDQGFWDVGSTGQPASEGGGVGLPTALMATVRPFRDAGWAIVDGWVSSDPPRAVWGSCAAPFNAGRPYLLWEYPSDPCGCPVTGTPAGTADPVAVVPQVLVSRRRVAAGGTVRAAIRAWAGCAGTAREVTSCITAPPGFGVVSTSAPALRAGRRTCFRVGDIGPGGQRTRVVQLRAGATGPVSVRVRGSARISGTATAARVAQSATIRVTRAVAAPAVAG